MRFVESCASDADIVSNGLKRRKRAPWVVLAFILTCCIANLAGPATVFGLAEATSGNIDMQAVTATEVTAETEPTTWPDFRGSPTNNAITEASTPRVTTSAGLMWVATLAEGYVSPEIIVDDEIIVTSGRGDKGVISKLDKTTGKVVSDAPMKRASTYSLMPPTYADGMIFVTLSNGGLQAFDAKTLKSLWFYENKLGGQGNCPIVYSDGLVFTGYWSGETTERSYVCLNAKTGKLVWETKNDGGYYWAGGLVVGDFLLFGSEDGKPANEVGDSIVRCVNKKTGEVVSTVTVKGDQRSTIVYDSKLGRAYFTSKPGWLYSVKLNDQTGDLSDLRSHKIDAESTATPLVFDDRVYVGGSSGGFSKGTLSVLDANTLQMLYQLGDTAGVDGTVKSAPLVSTAYAGASADEHDGKLYLYFTVNNPPGGIKALIVEPNSTSEEQAKVIDLFTPPTELQQYCISSVICDNEGNLYYRNDSNYLMTIGPSGTDPAHFKVPASSNSNSGNPWEPSSSSSSSKSGKGSSTSSSKSENGNPPSNDASNKGDEPKEEPAQEEGTSGGNSSDGGDARQTNIQGSGANANTGNSSGATGTTSGASQTGGSSVGNSSNASSGGSSTTNKSSASSSSESSGIASTQNDSTRHTDAAAATERLDKSADSGTPPWLVPAIVAGVASVALIGLFAARVVLGRRKPSGDAASESEEVDDRGTDELHDR